MATIQMSITSTPATGSKTFTGTDQDAQDILDWAKVQYADYIATNFGATPTNNQIFLAVAANWMKELKARVQRFKTTPPTVPPPISMS